jgi:Na+/proline symporter
LWWHNLFTSKEQFWEGQQQLQQQQSQQQVQKASAQQAVRQVLLFIFACLFFSYIITNYPSSVREREKK